MIDACAVAAQAVPTVRAIDALRRQASVFTVHPGSGFAAAGEARITVIFGAGVKMFVPRLSAGSGRSV